MCLYPRGFFVALLFPHATTCFYVYVLTFALRKGFIFVDYGLLEKGFLNLKRFYFMLTPSILDSLSSPWGTI
jgi:hypothetical protein